MEVVERNDRRRREEEEGAERNGERERSRNGDKSLHDRSDSPPHHSAPSRVRIDSPEDIEARNKKRGREERRRERRRESSSSDSSSSSASSSSYERRRRSKKKRKNREEEGEKEEERKKILAVEREKVLSLVAANKAVGSGRAGGVYIPPHRMALIREAEEKENGGKENGVTSESQQRARWEALRKSINGLVNKVSIHNLKNIVVEMLRENIERGRGLLVRSLMKSQLVSPKFTPVYAALIAVLNTKMPHIGVLLIKRLVDQFKKGYRRRDKNALLASTKFIAHLVNQYVCSVVLPLQILVLLLEHPTEDSIEVAVALIQEMGARLSENSPAAFNGIFDQFRSILHEGQVDKRVVYMIEGLFAVRRSEFKEYPAIMPELDVVEEDDQITHENISLEPEDDQDDPSLLDLEERLDYFKYDPEYDLHEAEYQTLAKEILGEDSEDSDSEESDSEDLAGNVNHTQTTEITDATYQDVTILKRAIYLTIMSSRDHEEVAHKLMKMNLPENDLIHVCKMVIQCCSQERTYLKFYGLIAQRFCAINRFFQEMFQGLFEETYLTIHRHENNPLRNIACLFSHLLFTDSLPWTVLQVIRLNERDTSASSRIFIKILFNNLVEYMGLPRLSKRLADPRLLHPFLEGLFPTNSPKDTKFAINYWTAIELGALTDQLRVAYNDMIKKIAERRAAQTEANTGDYHSSSGSGSDSSSNDSDSSSYSSSSSSSSGSYSSSR